VSGELFQIDQMQHLFELPGALRRAAQLPQSQGNVLGRGLPGEKAVALIDHAHATGAQHAPRRWLKKARQQIEQRRLSTSGRSHDSHEFASRNFQRKVTEHVNGAEAHRPVFDPQRLIFHIPN
jgi:hypothetical protein